ncbi:hypothetical protein QTN25_005375 [Entamoeba marina]
MDVINNTIYDKLCNEFTKCFKYFEEVKKGMSTTKEINETIENINKIPNEMNDSSLNQYETIYDKLEKLIRNKEIAMNKNKSVIKIIDDLM